MADYGGSISLSQARELSNSSDEEEEDHSPRTAPPLLGTTSTGIGQPRLTITTTTNNHRMGGGGHVTTRKPRGRPPGSKNKPKPPIVVAAENESAMKPTVLEISAGSDIIEMIVQFGRQRQLGVTIISSSGTVSNVTLRHPVSHAPSITLHGPFNILSLTGTFLGYSSPSSLLSSTSCFGISLAGGQGQIFGGIVAGKVIAASQVVLVGATFLNPTFHRLPPPASTAAEYEEGENQAKPSGGGASDGSTGSGLTMPVYGVNAPTPLNSCQVSPDHLMHWGRTSRPPPPY